ncbi:MAG: matrixin family metalloprotease [Methylococcales bacterium]
MKLRFCLKVVALTSVLSSFSAQAFVTSGFKWDSTTLGEGASLTWGFADDGSDCRVGSDACGGGTVSDVSGNIIPGEEPGTIFREISQAFDSWSDVADLAFSFTTDANPDILIGGHSVDGANNVLGHTFTSFFVNSGLDQADISDIHFDTDDTFGLDANTSGGFFPNFLAHEIGHALGLDHVSDVNALMNPIIQRSFIGPQADDIAGIRELYGESGTTPPDTTPIPLPAAFWMMLSGLGFFTTMRKRVVAQ